MVESLSQCFDAFTTHMNVFNDFGDPPSKRIFSINLKFPP